MVSQSNLPQEPASSSPRRVSASMAPAPSAARSRWRVHGRDAGSGRPRPGDIPHDQDAAVLQVDGARVSLAMVDDQTAHEPDRRLPSSARRARWARKIGRRTAVADLVQRRLGLELPATRRKSKMIEPLARLGALLAHPEIEAPNPVLQREAQSGVRRHHVAVTPSDPRGLQTGGHELGQGASDASIRRGLLERQGMVLVGPDGLSCRAALPSASQAQGTGGSPCSAIPSSSSRRVAASIEERDDVTHVDSIRARVHQGGDHVGSRRSHPPPPRDRGHVRSRSSGYSAAGGPVRSPSGRCP